MAGCSAKKQGEQNYQQAQKDLKKPVNCGTAEGDIRSLESEKAHTKEMIGSGVLAIVPISLVVGTIRGKEGKRIEIATGEYNKKLDEKIKEIKTACNITS
jgi:hypothetical protein